MGPEVRGLRVHGRQRRLASAARPGERVCRVVAGRHQQGLEQLLGGVVQAGDDAHPGSVRVRVVLAGPHDRRRRHLRDQHQGRQGLERAGGQQPGVRRLRRDHRSRVRVRQHPRHGAQRGRRRHTRRQVRDDPHAREPRPADRHRRVDGRPRHRQRRCALRRRGRRRRCRGATPHRDHHRQKERKRPFRGARRAATDHQGSEPRGQERPLHFLDRLRHLDAARAGVGAVEGRAAAPHALLVVQHLEPLRRRPRRGCRR